MKRTEISVPAAPPWTWNVRVCELFAPEAATTPGLTSTQIGAGRSGPEMPGMFRATNQQCGPLALSLLRMYQMSAAINPITMVETRNFSRLGHPATGGLTVSR